MEYSSEVPPWLLVTVFYDESDLKYENQYDLLTLVSKRLAKYIEGIFKDTQ